MDIDKDVDEGDIGYCMALHLIVYYPDLAAYLILASFLLLFILPLTRTLSSIFAFTGDGQGVFAS